VFPCFFMRKGFSVARSYYAMFYVAEALLLGRGLSFSRHSAVIAAFGLHFTKTCVFPGEYQRHLTEAESLLTPPSLTRLCRLPGICRCRPTRHYFQRQQVLLRVATTTQPSSSPSHLGLLRSGHIYCKPMES
jgi:hypothetical protein